MLPRLHSLYLNALSRDCGMFRYFCPRILSHPVLFTVVPRGARQLVTDRSSRSPPPDQETDPRGSVVRRRRTVDAAGVDAQHLLTGLGLHHIRNKADTVTHCRIPCGTPVKQGPAKRLADWSHSSYHRSMAVGEAATRTHIHMCHPCDQLLYPINNITLAPRHPCDFI